MIRKLVGLIVLLLLLPFYLSGQSMEFAPIGAEWIFEYKIYSQGQFFSSLYKVKSEKDTVIDNQVVRQSDITGIGLDGDPFSLEKQYIYQSGDSIFIFTDGAFQLLYDFSLKAGDSFSYKPYNYVHVDSLTTVMIKGVPHKGQYLSFFCGVDSIKWGSMLAVEKIGPIQYIGDGSSSYLFYDEVICLADGPTIRFRCYQDEDVGQYSVIDGPCDSLSTSLSPNPSSFHNNFLVFPNPARDKVLLKQSSGIRAPINDLKNGFRINLYDIQGRLMLTAIKYDLNDSQLDISHLSNGVYTIEITQGNSLLLTRKLLIKQ